MVISKKNYYGILKFKPMGKTVGPWRYYFCVRHTSRITYHVSRITHHASRNDSQVHFGMTAMVEENRRTLALLILRASHVMRHASRNDSQAHFAMTQMTALVDI